MTPADMVFLLRQHLSDEQNVGWRNDSELEAFLDRAVDYLSEHLIMNRDPSMLGKFRLDGETGLPGDFAAFAGQAPAYVLEQRAIPYLAEPADIIYWRRMPHFSTLPRSAQTPYPHEWELLITDIARMFALNKNEYDISQDMALLGEIKNTVRGARGNVAPGG